MRIYDNPFEAFREVERDLFEMGIDVHPQTMQDKDVKDNPDYRTKELQHYGFQLRRTVYMDPMIAHAVAYVMTRPNAQDVDRKKIDQVLKYIDAEFNDRVGGIALNPGNSYKERQGIWNEFLHEGKFSYTYSERMAPQVHRILYELKQRPVTRQAIINIHTNICPMSYEYNEADQVARGVATVFDSRDFENMGGQGRIPCSLYYQFMRRRGCLDMVYAMRSCDFLTHFPVDIALALRLQNWFAQKLGDKLGLFTYFTGSLHAYYKDLKERGIF